MEEKADGLGHHLMPMVVTGALGTWIDQWGHLILWARTRSQMVQAGEKKYLSEKSDLRSAADRWWHHKSDDGTFLGPSYW